MSVFFGKLKRFLSPSQIFLSKEKMLLGVIDLGILMAAIYFVIFCLLQSIVKVFFLGFFLLLISFFRFIVVKGRLKMPNAVHVLICIITFCLIVPLMYYTGGLYSSLTSWLLLPPLVCVMLFGNSKSTKLWLTIVLVILFVFAILNQEGYVFPNLISESIRGIHLLLSMIGLIVCVFWLTMIFENWKNNVLASLERTRKILEKSNATAKIGSWSIDFDNNLVKNSMSALKIHDWNSENTSLELYTARFKNSENYLQFLTGLQTLNKEDESEFDEELQIVTSENIERWVRIIGVPIFERDRCVGAYGLIQDIHEQKIAEMNLIKERERLEYVIQGADLGTWEWNIQTGAVVFNERWAEFIGYRLDELSPCTIEILDTLIYEEDKEQSQRAMNKYFEGESGFYQCEIRMRHKEGHLVWMLVQGKVFTYDENGKPLWMYGTHIENTKEKQLLEELKISESYANSLIASIPDLLFVLTKEGVFLDYKAPEHDLYSQPDFFLGKSLKYVFPSKLGQQLTDKISESITTNKLVEFNYQLEIKNVSRYYNARIAPFQKDKVIVLCRDNTENFLAEKELRMLSQKFMSIVDHSPVGITLNDYKTGRFIEVNDALLSFTGYSREEFLKLNFQDLTPGGNQALDRAELDLLELQGKFSNYETECVRKDGSILPIAVNGVLFKDELDEKTILMIVRDISQQKENEIALKIAKEQAEIANRAKSEFLTNISHEIRTPLNAIIGFTDLLLKTALTEVQKEYMGNVFQSGQALLELINDILDLSKIEAGKLDLVLDQVDLHKLGKQVVEILKYQAENKGLELKLEVSDTIPKLVYIDSAKLRQILFNLLSNALKFTGTGKVKLKMQTIDYPGSSEVKLRFSVTDTGMGIAEENQQKIFEAFTQEDPSIIKKFGGTGLGLTISNKLLHLMGSELTLKSRQGEGSTFYFDLLLQLVQEKENRVDIISNPITAAKGRNKEEEKQEIFFLLVEDNSTNMLLLKSYFQNIISGVHLLEAKDGEVALDLFKQYKPLMVITDIQMPKLNGYELTTSIRALSYGKTVPIIALTAGILNGEKEKCYAIGMNDYLSKPVLQDTLMLTIEKWLAPTLKSLLATPKQTLGTFHHTSERLSKVLNISKEDADEIVLVAKRALKDSLYDLDEFCDKDNIEALKHTAHKIRATALTLGFSVLHKIAYVVETSTEISISELRPAVAQLKYEIDNVMKRI